MLMSAAATIPIPPARTGPATRATTGFGFGHDRPLDIDHPLRPDPHADRGRLGQVGTGAEHLQRRPDHDHPDGVVRARRLELLQQLTGELLRERVLVMR